MDRLLEVGTEGEKEMTHFGLLVMKDRNVRIQNDTLRVHRISIVDQLTLAIFARGLQFFVLLCLAKTDMNSTCKTYWVVTCPGTMRSTARIGKL